MGILVPLGSPLREKVAGLVRTAAPRQSQVAGLVEVEGLREAQVANLAGVAALRRSQIAALIGLTVHQCQDSPRPQWPHQSSRAPLALVPVLSSSAGLLQIRFPPRVEVAGLVGVAALSQAEFAVLGAILVAVGPASEGLEVSRSTVVRSFLTSLVLHGGLPSSMCSSKIRQRKAPNMLTDPVHLTHLLSSVRRSCSLPSPIFDERASFASSESRATFRRLRPYARIPNKVSPRPYRGIALPSKLSSLAQNSRKSSCKQCLQTHVCHACQRRSRPPR
jgi:hypothetical protein